MKLSELRDGFHPSWSIVLDHDRQPYVGDMVDDVRALTLEAVQASEAFAAFAAEFPGSVHVPENEQDLEQVKSYLLGAPFNYYDSTIQVFLSALSAPKTTAGVEKVSDHNAHIYTFSYVGYWQSAAYMAARKLAALEIVHLREAPVRNFLDVLEASGHDLENARYFISEAAADEDTARRQRYLRCYRALAAAWARPQDRDALLLADGLLTIDEAARVDEVSRFTMRTAYAELGKEVWALALLGVSDETASRLTASLWDSEQEDVRQQLDLLRRRQEKGYRFERPDAIEEALVRVRAYVTYWLLFGSDGERRYAELVGTATNPVA